MNRETLASKLDDYDKMSYRKYTQKSEMDKAIHTLEGILKGIVIDDAINSKELIELSAWCNTYSHFINCSPMDEIINMISCAIDDGVIDEEEKDDILWLCNTLTTRNLYYDIITSDIQRLQGILHGIIADNYIDDEEIIELRKWINDNNHLLGKYPYDEISSLLNSVLADGKIDDTERNMLKLFFSDFVDKNISSNLNPDELDRLRQEISIQGICALSPQIIIKDKNFCFTGASSRIVRREIADIVTSLGGIFNNNIVKNTDYLVVGDEGNPCWAFSCYGRKVEKAVNMRKEGHKILIVHENDFWDCIKNA